MPEKASKENVASIGLNDIAMAKYQLARRTTIATAVEQINCMWY